MVKSESHNFYDNAVRAVLCIPPELVTEPQIAVYFKRAEDEGYGPQKLDILTIRATQRLQR